MDLKLNLLPNRMGAKLAHDFGEWRNQNQELFANRTVNKAAYALDGFLDSILHSCKDLDKKVSVAVGNRPLTLPSCEEILILNIPSYGGGIDVWGNAHDDQVSRPRPKFLLVFFLSSIVFPFLVLRPRDQ